LSFGVEQRSDIDYARYIRAVCQELRAYQSFAGAYRVATIYFGGGTPSILDAHYISQILQTIRECFVVEENAEITIECNPGTTDYEKFCAYRSYGVNRLSLGLQTTDDSLLKRLGRIHTYEQFATEYELARKAGFSNINIDLMHALPGQTLGAYEQSLDTVIGLQPEHISSYSLILEEGTAFFEDAAIRAMLPDEETAVHAYELTCDRLEQAGYQRYEISNYCKQGYESRHNTSYWIGTSYIGAGLGASSYLTEPHWVRYHNETEYCSYIIGCEALDSQTHKIEERWQEVEHLSVKSRMEEYVFLGLRMMRGICLEEFERRFGERMQAVYDAPIRKHIALGNLRCYENAGESYLALTKQGVLISNSVFVDFMF
jgi:oxygen-independent coproporphyrinogen-3 oxidase